MKIKINSEEELISTCQEAIHILANLRKFSKLWNEHHGSYFKEKKKYWEEKADALIEQLQVPEHREASQIKIEVNKD